MKNVDGLVREFYEKESRELTASPSGDRVSYSSETSYSSCGVCSAFNSAIAASLASVLSEILSHSNQAPY